MLEASNYKLYFAGRINQFLTAAHCHFVTHTIPPSPQPFVALVYRTILEKLLTLHKLVCFNVTKFSPFFFSPVGVLCGFTTCSMCAEWIGCFPE